MNKKVGEPGSMAPEDETPGGLSGTLLYLTSLATWHTFMGAQNVLLPWIVISVLGAASVTLGYVEVALMLPSVLLMTLAGTITDHVSRRKATALAHMLVCGALLFLSFAVSRYGLSVEVLYPYAVLVGCAMSFGVPARDAMLHEIAGSKLHSLVLISTGVQYGVQLIGFVLAALAIYVGPEPITTTLALIVGAGGLLVLFVSRDSEHGRLEQINLWDLIRRSVHLWKDGAVYVFSNDEIRRPILYQWLIGTIHMGAFIVLVPAVVSDRFDEIAPALSYSHAVFMIGLVAATIIGFNLFKPEQGLVVFIFSPLVGAVAFAAASFTQSFWVFLCLVFVWGGSAALAIGFGRSIVQNKTDVSFQARSLSYYHLGIIGGSPIGALLVGMGIDASTPESVGIALFVAMIVGAAIVEGHRFLNRKGRIIG